MRFAAATALGCLALSLPAFARDTVAPAAMPAPASAPARQLLERPPHAPPRERAAAAGGRDLDSLAPIARLRLDAPLDVALAAAFIRLRARPF